MLEAGAREVFPSFRDAPIVRIAADLATLTGRFAATAASVMTVHLCSTVPMGEDRSVAAADSVGRVHGTDNVYVNDASLLPDAPGVNPQASVMAVALRNARRFIARPVVIADRRSRPARRRPDGDGDHRGCRLARHGPGARPGARPRPLASRRSDPATRP